MAKIGRWPWAEQEKNTEEKKAKSVKVPMLPRGFLRESQEMKQREQMRELYKRYRGDRGQIIAAYAAAEERGEVVRKRNLRSLPPETYAERLFEDGMRKGWMAGSLD